MSFSRVAFLVAIAVPLALTGCDDGVCFVVDGVVICEPEEPTGNTLRFGSIQQAVTEAVPSVTLTVTAEDQPAVETEVVVALTSGDPEDLGGYEPVVLTFSPQSPSEQTVTVSITDDAFPEGNESFVFELLVADEDAEGDEPEFEVGGATAIVVVDNDGAPVATTLPARDADGDGLEDGGLSLFSLPLNGIRAGAVADAAGTDEVFVLVADGSGSSRLVEVDRDFVISAGQPILVDVAPAASLSFTGSAPSDSVFSSTAEFALEDAGVTDRVLVAVGNPSGAPLDLSALDIEGGTLTDVVLVLDERSGAFRPISLAGLEGDPAIGAFGVVVLQIVPDACADGPCEVSVATPTQSESNDGVVIGDQVFEPVDGETAVVVALRPATGTARIEAPDPGDTFALRFLEGGSRGLDRFDALDLPTPAGGVLASFGPTPGVDQAVPFAAMALATLESGTPVTVPLIVAVPRDGTYEIALDEMPSAVGGRPVVVELFDGTTSNVLEPGSAVVFEAEADTAYVGRFVIRVSVLSNVATDESGLATSSLSIFPNPSAGAVKVRLSTPLPEDARVSVYDVLGREVAILHEGPAAFGLQLEVRAGRLAPGTYVLRAEGAGVIRSRALTIVQ